MALRTYLAVVLSAFLGGLGTNGADTEAPYFTRCPTDITIESSKDRVRVNWQEPYFFDNSGKPPMVTSNYPCGSLFLPGQYVVVYTATDEYGNKNTSCSFTIRLKAKTCPHQRPPHNGALVCLSTRERICTVVCQDGFDFGYPPAYLYYCSGGRWYAWPPFQLARPHWPDCAVRDGSTRMKGSAHYYVGECSDPDVQAHLKDYFIATASDLYSVPPSFCVANRSCKSENVQVYCGERSNS